MQRSIQRDAGRWSDLKDYNFQRLEVQKRLDKNGAVTDTESQLEEVLILGGRPYYRLVEKNGQPLSEKDARKEQGKLDKEAAKRAKETDQDRAKREKQEKEDGRAANEIPDAFDFTLLGEERIDGLPVWKIHGEPKPGFKPRHKDADALRKIRGTLWIEQTNYQWVRAELELTDTISFGWFVLRIQPGATVTLAQMRVNDEIWVPKEVHVRGNAKLALLKTFRAQVDITFRNYRKFGTDSQILDVQEAPVGHN